MNTSVKFVYMLHKVCFFVILDVSTNYGQSVPPSPTI